jgi:hypothetical protein
MLIHDSAVVQDQPNRAGDPTGIDVLLHEAIDACEAIGCKCGPLGRKGPDATDQQSQS